MSDDELLEPLPRVANNSLRSELLAATTRRLRFTRRLRVAARAGVCAACFLAGTSVALLSPTPEPETVTVVVREQVPVAPAPAPVPVPVKQLSPAELELEAEKTLVKAESARRFREAGDLYLRDYADYSAALRCYRNFLDEADPVDRVVTPEDTWLLTSLKRAREQETNP